MFAKLPRKCTEILADMKAGGDEITGDFARQPFCLDSTPILITKRNPPEEPKSPLFSSKMLDPVTLSYFHGVIAVAMRMDL